MYFRAQKFFSADHRCHCNWPQPSCPWKSSSIALRVSQTYLEMGYRWVHPFSFAQILSPSDSISWISPRLHLTQQCSTDSPRQQLLINVLKEPSAAPGLFSYVQGMISLVLGEGPSRMFSNDREKAQRLITWSATICPARKPSFELGKIKQQEEGGTTAQSRKRDRKISCGHPKAQGSRPQKLHPMLMAEGQSPWGN